MLLVLSTSSPVCFLRQFGGSISNADYFNLHHRFIMLTWWLGYHFIAASFKLTWKVWIIKGPLDIYYSSTPITPQCAELGLRCHHTSRKSASWIYQVLGHGHR